MTLKLCPNCNGTLYAYSKCFDCKQVIQQVCYKCHWEGNLRDHTECHKNVSLAYVSKPNFQKQGYPVFDELKYKVNEMYHTPLQMVAPVFSLIH